MALVGLIDIIGGALAIKSASQCTVPRDIPGCLPRQAGAIARRPVFTTKKLQDDVWLMVSGTYGEGYLNSSFDGAKYLDKRMSRRRPAGHVQDIMISAFSGHGQ